MHAATFSGTNYSLNGTYGPGGIGSYSQLLVVLKARFTDGSGANPVNLANLSYGTSSPDSAQSNIMFANKEVEIQAGRNGVGCASNNNQGSGTIGCYALTANQIVTVQKYTNFVHLTATPSAVRSGQQVTFQATSDEAGLVSYGWVWTRDPGTNANPANGCNSWVTLCTAQIYGSGTMTANTNYGAASAHVTVYTSFTLDAVPSTVVAGASVTFTPRLDGSATPAARWRWVPSASAGVNTAPCPSGVSTCTRAVMSTGAMWAYLASTPGVGDSASALVTVTSDSTSVGNGATCPSGALCANATLHVIRGSGVTGSQIPADGSVYPINSVVGYSFGPDAGYREIALVVDDIGRATTGIITMDHDHTIEIEADSDYMLNPDIASISARLLSLVHASDPPSAYSEFLNWYRNEGVARGFDDLDGAIDVADYMTFDVGRDSVMLNAFDEALGGVVFQVLRAGNSTTFEFMRPGDYAPVGITSRRRAQGAALSLTPASGRPSITYINGMNTTRTTFETSASKFASLVTAASLSSVADA